MHHYIADIVGGLHNEGDWNDNRRTRGCVAKPSHCLIHRLIASMHHDVTKFNALTWGSCNQSMN